MLRGTTGVKKNSMQAEAEESKNTYPDNKLSIIGGGFIAAIEAYYAYLTAKQNNSKLRVTIHEKNKNIIETTTSNIAPSLTPDEIMSVVPRGKELSEKLKYKFNENSGVRVDDVKGVNDSSISKEFIKQVEAYGKDDKGHQQRSRALLELGKLSMQLWQNMYDTADNELKQILKESNFNPCRELTNSGNKVLHDGYRIDLIYNVSNAKNRALGMKKDYESLGYNNCKVLTPNEVEELDPFLTDFCETNSKMTASGKREWNNDAVALFRPGGCIDAKIFLPKFYDYLKNVMGKYVNEDGKLKDCFRLKFDREVNQIDFEANNNIKGLGYTNNSNEQKKTHHKHVYKQSSYLLAPGESVGTLNKLGLNEPAYARFAGASLILTIPVSQDKLNEYSKFNHCMEVHQEGVVLAWQARFNDGKICIAVAGTKAFYSDQSPNKNEEFARDRNLLQLNMINDVLPDFISLAMNKNTKGTVLTEKDLEHLETNGIANRWVGTRAVAYDGFPTLGAVFNKNGKVNNARVTTHLGSGGVAFSHATIFSSRSIEDKSNTNDLVEKVMTFGSSLRKQ